MIYRHITNALPREQNITYFESVPWFMRVYFHTLRVTINGSMFVSGERGEVREVR